MLRLFWIRRITFIAVLLFLVIAVAADVRDSGCLRIDSIQPIAF